MTISFLFAGFFVACSSKHRPCSSGRDSDMSRESSPVAPGAAVSLFDRRSADSLTPRKSIAALSLSFEQRSRRTQPSPPYPNGISPLGDADNSLRTEAITTIMDSNLVRQGQKALSRHQHTPTNQMNIPPYAEGMRPGNSLSNRTHQTSSSLIQSSHLHGEIPLHSIIPSKPLNDSTAYIVVSPPLSPSSRSTEDDSGYDSAYDAPSCSSASRTDRRVRRNMTTKDSSAKLHICVTKPIRMRTREERRDPEKALQQERDG